MENEMRIRSKKSSRVQKRNRHMVSIGKHEYEILKLMSRKYGTYQNAARIAIEDLAKKDGGHVMEDPFAKATSS